MLKLMCSNPSCKKGMAVYRIGDSRFCVSCTQQIRKSSGLDLARLDLHAKQIFHVKDSLIEVQAYFHEIMDVTGATHATMIHCLSMASHVLRAGQSATMPGQARSYLPLTSGEGLFLSEALDKCREWIDEVCETMEIRAHHTGKQQTYSVFNPKSKEM